MEQVLPFDQTTDEGRKDFKLPCGKKTPQKDYFSQSRHLY